MKQFFLIFLMMFGIILSTKSQNIYTLQNGKIILATNNQYFDITGSDTLSIDTNAVLVLFKSVTSQQRIDSIELINDISKRFLFKTGWKSYEVPSSMTWITFIQFLLSLPEIQNVGFNYLLTYSSNPNDPLFSDQWYMDDIQVPDAWSIATGDPELIVGVLDNGTDWSNPDIGPDNNLGYDYVNFSPNTYPSSQALFHGTMVSAIIAARTNNGIFSSGIAGGWNSNPVKIAMYKVGDANPTEEAIIAALDDATSQGVRLFNFSWGFGGPYTHCTDFPQPLSDEIVFIYDVYDAIMFACTGNENIEDLRWPACTEYVIGVGGTIEDGSRWNTYTGGSNWGENTDISAPATNILYPIPYTQNYTYLGGGTSASCPIAVGVAALMVSVNPCLTNLEVFNILKETADTTGGYDYNWDPERPGHSKELGYGKINAYKALLMASNPLTEITSNITFNSPQWFTHNLTIKSGNTLTISSTIKFTEGTKIIVEPGAKLLIDGGTLTSSCTGFWDGIEVQGNRYLPQVPVSNQGYVRVYNYGMIENANPGIYSHDGGIVYADDGIFRNNMRSVIISDYPGNNISSFTRCQFEWTNIPGSTYGNPLFTGNQFFLKAELVKPIKINGCTFENSIDLSTTPYYKRGYGIEALNSEIIIKGASTKNPISIDPNAVKTFFKKLRYGVRASRSGNQYTVRVSHTRFEDNLIGLITSGFTGTSYAQVILSKFKALSPSLAPGYESYAMYMNNCSEYTVEDNEFYSSDASPQGIGLIINQSGINDNMIYNNQFHQLEFAVLAQGCNRYSDISGLCFQCNDFYNNSNDIAITSIAPPDNPYQGIAVYQGNPTTPAGNTFTIEPNVYDINNPFDQIAYYHDENYGSYEVIPYPTVGVTNYPVSGTTYDKNEDCPSHFSGGGLPDNFVQDLNEAKDKSDSLGQILMQLVDGGSTDTLVDEVQYSAPPEALETRDHLLQESPYLSDSVMRTAIIKEIVLPNTMIRDILVANPQSAKSDYVLGTLDQRAVPMPDSMMAQIIEGLDLTSAKEELTAEISGWNRLYLHSFKNLMRLYNEDTTNQNGFDSLVSLVYGKESLENRYDLVSLYFGKGMFVEGNSVLDSIPQQFDLTPEELSNHNKFVDLSSIMQHVSIDSEGLQSLDSIQIATLTNIAVDDRYLAGVYARNLLIMIGHLQYTEPVILPDGSTKSGWKRNHNPSKLKNDLYYLGVFPNPAGIFFIVEYNVSIDILPGEKIFITISDMLGHALKFYERTIQYDQITIPTQDLPSGTYLVTLKKGNVIKKATKIIISK